MIFWRFRRDEAGVVGPLFALSLVPIMALVGAAIDLSAMTRDRAMLQIAADSTALAINHELHLSSTQQGIQAKAQDFFAIQVKDLENPRLLPVEFELAEGRVEVTAMATFTPNIMQVIGFGPFELEVKATTVVGDQEIEIALVLDNSGSMAGSKIQSLRDAASDLVTTLFETTSATTRVRIGVVPFSGAVNVGSANKSKPWVDTQALSPVHSENFVMAANRFTLLGQMTNIGWAGCVESRPGEHAVKDTLPTVSNPASLFVPMFAPDEPDDDGKYMNDYLDDEGINGNCTSAQKSDKSNAGKQSRVCKYKGQKPDTDSWNSTNKGPNFWCNSKPILPLTDNKQTLLDMTGTMQAKGYTNIHEGLMWGWRVLSPRAPFEEGAAYDTPNLRKYIVLMTDGANTINDRDNHNNSDYSAYGYASNNRLAPNSEDMAGWQLKNAMDNRLKEACENAKQGESGHEITIYTIAFKVSEAATLKRLSDCASSPSMAKTADSESELEAVFNSIARDLGKLRLAE